MSWSWRSRIVAWLGLVALFTVAYLLNNRPGGLHRNLTSDYLTLFPGVFFVLFFGKLAFNFWAARSVHEGMALINQGRYSAGLASIERARGRLPKGPLSFYLGFAHLQLWHLEEAQAHFECVRPGLNRTLKTMTPPRLAVVHALRGQVQDCEQQLAVVDQLQIEGTPEALLARAVLAIRAGRWLDAEAVLKRHEIHVLGGPMRGLADALKASVARELRGERLGIDRVALLGEADVSRLQGAWPELASFLQPGPG